MLFRIIVLILYVNSFCSAQTLYPLTDADRNSILDYHNKLRAIYGVPALVWNPSLETQAGNYAKGCLFKHSGGSGYGENLAVNGAAPKPTKNPYVSWKTQLDGWKTEESTWDCKNNICPTNAQCGHLTAMIWKETTSVGCGVAYCDPGTIYPSYWSQYIVCQYDPAGNNPSKHPMLAPLPGPCNTCPSLPTPTIIPASGVPTGPAPVGGQPTVPVGTSFPQGPPPAAPIAAPQSPPPAFPPATPGAPAWSKCIGDYWPGGVQKLTPCNAAPRTFSSKLYCDVKDPKKNLWPVYNAGTTDCNYVASLTNEDDATQDGLLGLSTGAWIGIAVGIAVFIIIVIVVIIVIKKRSEDERV